MHHLRRIAACLHLMDWVEVSDPAVHRLIDPGRLGRLVKTLTSPQSQYPQVLVCVGGGEKRRALETILPSLETHRARSRQGLADIHVDPRTLERTHPLFVVDCAHDAPLPVRRRTRRPQVSSFDVVWPATESDVRHRLLTRLVVPFADVVSIFAEDLGGLDSVLALLQQWVAGGMATTLPWKARPRVCVVADAAETENAREAQSRFNALLRTIKYRRHFSSVRLMTVDSRADTPEGRRRRGRDIRRMLVEGELPVALAHRGAADVLFAAHHFSWFFTQAVAHLARSPDEPFDFIRVSRARRPLPASVDDQLAAFFRLALQHRFTLDAVVTLVAAAVVVDAYPPGCHRKFESCVSVAEEAQLTACRLLPCGPVRCLVFRTDPEGLGNRLRLGSRS